MAADLAALGRGLLASTGLVLAWTAAGVAPALATCTISGPTQTCQGNLPGGLQVLDPGVFELVVNNLTGPIAPAAGAFGIGLQTYGVGTLTFTGGSHSISAVDSNALLLTGRSNLVLNASGNGSTSGSGGLFGASGVYVQAFDNDYASATVNYTSGTISTTGDFANGIGVVGTYFGPNTITSNANINTSGTSAHGILGLFGYGGYTITSTGNIAATGMQASGIFVYSEDKVVITVSGSVSGKGMDGNGIYVAAGWNAPTNITILAGTTVTGGSGSGAGVYLQTLQGLTTINNAGAISALSGSAIYGFFDRHVINNTGTIIGGVSFYRFDDTINNSGTITGNLSLGDGLNTVNNKGGTITGHIVTGTGDDIVTNSGTITGDITLGDGNNSVTNSGSIAGKLLFGKDQNTVINSGAIVGDLEFGNGNNSIGNSGVIIGNVRTGLGNDTLTNSGTMVGNLLLGAGNNTVNNSGSFSGNVQLGTGTSAFNNLEGGIFVAGTAVNLGSGNVLTNAGTLALGASGTQTTALTGNFVQTATGTYNVTADWTTGAASRLDVSGTAALGGRVAVNPLSFPTTVGLTKTFTVLTAAGGITNNGITVADTAAVDYTVLFPDANTMTVKAAINFQGVGGGGNLSGNQSAVGGALNQLAGESSKLPGFVQFLAGLGSGNDLAAALTQLSPTGDGASSVAAMRTSTTFANQLMSCRITGEGDAAAVIREGQCLWARASVRKTNVETTSSAPGYHETATFFSGGAQVDIGGPWRLGAGIGYETPSLTQSGGGGKSEAERLHVGGVLKYNPGPWLVAASLNGGFGWHESARVVNFAGFSSVAHSESESSFLAARLSTSYLFSLGAAYLKPQLDVAHTWLRRDRYRETGSGGIALDVAAANASVWSVSPALEVGMEQKVAGLGVIRPYVRAGVTWRDTASFTTTAAFVEATQAAPFSISSKVDRTMADFGAGIDFIGIGDSVLRLQYDGQAGETTTQHSGSAKVSIRF